MKKLLFISAFIFTSTLAYAQARPTDKFTWNQDASSLIVAQSYRYELELDSAVLTTPLVATCSGTITPFTCESPIPPITPSSHTVRLRAVDTSNAAPLVGEWSDLFTFVMHALPAKPVGIGIIRGN